MLLKKFDDETPVAAMTIGQVGQWLDDYLARGGGSAAGGKAGGAGGIPEGSPRYVYGIRGIMRLFNVSNVTAQRYKRGILAPAVRQVGRKIVVDADMALGLFGKAARGECGGTEK